MIVWDARDVIAVAAMTIAIVVTVVTENVNAIAAKANVTAVTEIAVTANVQVAAINA